MMQISLDTMIDNYVRLLVEAKVREILERGGKESLPSCGEVEILPLRKAAPFLGYDSSRPLYQDIDDGLLRVGYEVEDRRRPGSSSPRYFINVPAARQRLSLTPEERTS